MPSRLGHTLHGHRPPAADRGAASLTVVMVLFFIVSLVAAYTSRNLVFEQRTAANQYRSTQAFEAADAGLEWTLAMLNGGRIDAACGPGAATDSTFRLRYLTIAEPSGNVAARTQPGGGALWPSCVFDGNGWSCSCPDAGPPALGVPEGPGPFPAFRVRFVADVSLPPGTIRVEVNGCTRLDDACLNFPASPVASEGRATVAALVALKSGLAQPPAAALTARRDIALGAPASVVVYNTDVAAGALTVQTGGMIDDPHDRLRVVTAAGGSADASLVAGDPGLAALGDPAPPLSAADRMFVSTFAAARSVYLEQPGIIGLDCPLAGCTADVVRDRAAANPGRMIHVRGDLLVDAGDVGSANDPVLLLVDGDLDLQAPAARVFGLVYGTAATFALLGNGEIHGAVIAESAFASNGSPTIVYNAAALSRLRLQHGSFVRVPGSWKDFP